MQIPHAEKGFICPLHKKDVSTVCHKCSWWTRIIGKNPQSMEMMDDWRCAIAMLPMLLIDNTQQTRQAGAATESMRNEIVKGITKSIYGRLIDASNSRDR